MIWDAILIGFGPGGAALAWLLASRGLRTLVIERAIDFHRAFRGEGLQPAGVEALAAMGLSEALAEAPQRRPRRMRVHNGRAIADFQMSETSGATLVSQGGLLEAIARRCEALPNFRLHRGAVFLDLLREGGRVVGALARVDGEVVELRSRIVIGADGRGSAVARKAGITRTSLEQGYDVLWFKADLGDLLGGDAAWLEIRPGRATLAYPSPDGLDQVGFIVPKDQVPETSGAARLDWILERLTPELAGAVRARAETLVGPTRLSVVCERAERWTTPGLLLLGDAAHPMSPVGGQGINMALRDALVIANHLVPALRAGDDERVDAAASAAAAERMAEIVPVQTIQTRSGARLLRPPRLLLWLLPWMARLGLRMRAVGERRRLRTGLQPVALTV